MAKQRPELGTFARPVSTFVSPIEARNMVTPVDEQAIRETYAFADAFSDLSQSMVKLAGTIKADSNKEDYLAGQELVNKSRKQYADLVSTGQINPAENPWLAVGAQEASGFIEASQARAEFQQIYDREVANNPELLKDSSYFDALAASFVAQKSAKFGTAQYLSRSFYKDFNPYLVTMSAQHSEAVGKYSQNRIMLATQLKTADELANVEKARVPGYRQKIDGVDDQPPAQNFGLRPDGTPKGAGWLGILYNANNEPVTEYSIGVEIDGKQMDIPTLVPTLTEEEIRSVRYASSFPPDDPRSQPSAEIVQKAVDHARKRIANGQSPFRTDAEPDVNEKAYMDAVGKSVSEIQMFMDEMGRNMGQPRVVNLTVAQNLIRMMSEGGDPDAAEEVLNSLKSGTGRLVDVSEVKAMLQNAAPDIAKNRFGIRNKQETALVESFISREFDSVYNTVASRGDSAVVGPDVERFRSLLGQLPTIGVEQENKLLSQYVESWNKARKEGASFLDGVSMSRLRSRFIEDFKNDRSEVKDYATMRRNLNATLVSLNIPLDSEKGRKAVGEMMTTVDRALQDTIPQFVKGTNEMLAKMKAEGKISGPVPEITTIYPERNDPPFVAEAKAMARGVYNMNRIIAGVEFESPELLIDYRRPATSGITPVSVESGVDPQLADLIYAYNASRGGYFPTEKLLGTGDGSKRVAEFLQSVSAKMSAGIPISEAVRDSSQNVNLNIPGLALTDIAQGGAQAEDLRAAMAAAKEEFLEDQSVLGPFWENFFPWAGGVLNPDSESVFHSMYAQAYVASLNDTKDHKAAIEAANKMVNSDLLFYNGAVFRKSAMDTYNVDTFLIAEFISSKTDVPKATLVTVGFDQRNLPIMALRSPEGNSINNEYYTFEQISSPEVRIPLIKSIERRRREEVADIERIRREMPKTPTQPKF